MSERFKAKYVTGFGIWGLTILTHNMLHRETATIAISLTLKSP